MEFSRCRRNRFCDRRLRHFFAAATNTVLQNSAAYAKAQSATAKRLLANNIEVDVILGELATRTIYRFENRQAVPRPAMQIINGRTANWDK